MNFYFFDFNYFCEFFECFYLYLLQKKLKTSAYVRYYQQIFDFQLLMIGYSRIVFKLYSYWISASSNRKVGGVKYREKTRS